MRFRDLGPLVVQVDDREVAVKGAKLRAILAVLVLRANQRVSVDVLLDAVWGVDAGPNRVSTLESHIWRLRRILEPGRGRGEPPQILINDAAGYRLLALADQIDSARFERLAEDTRELSALGEFGRAIQVADQALGLWRGPLYEIVSDHASVEPVLARFIEARRQVSVRRIDALMATGASERALGDLGGLLTDAPFDEHLWAARMLALHRLGRTQEALQSFHDARAVLLDDVGIEPGEELTSLQRRILDLDPELVVRASVPAGRAGAAAPVRLPSTLTPLLGRADTVAQLRSLVGKHRLITVTGPAGCGKTRLSVELANDISGDFRDGTWFVDLASVDEPTLVPDIVLSTIGIDPLASGTGLDALRAYCRDRALVLLLDNCEHVLAAATAVAETIVGAAPGCTVLATSREPLEVDGEVLWTLGPLALPDPDSGAQADPAASPAVALFLDRIHAADPTRDPTDADLRLVVETCIALDGLPLAIELAASRIRSATLAEIATEVAEDPSGLRRPGRSGRPGRATVRDSIEAGHRLLTAPEQALHRRLAVLPGSFTRAVAAAVAVGEPVGSGEISYLLDSLVHRSLLTSTPGRDASGRSQFRQLATVRGHAQHALRVADEEAATARRRDAWVAEFVAQRPRLGHRDDAGWYPVALEALPTIRAALERTIVRDAAPIGVHLVSRLTMFWYFHSRLAEGLRWGRIAENAPEGDALTRVTVELAVAAGDAVRGRADLAVPRVERALYQVTAMRLADLGPTDLVELGDHYAPLAIALAPSGATDVVSALGRSAGDLARVTGDAGLAVLGEALDCAATARISDSRITAARNVELYERALDVGHVFAAIVASGTNIALALAARDPAGRVWAERSYRLHRSQGGIQNVLLFESIANFAAFAGDTRTAARLLAASRASARRTDTVWPRHQVTRATMAELERVLTRDDFDKAWRDGLTLTVEQILAAG